LSVWERGRPARMTSERKSGPDARASIVVSTIYEIAYKNDEGQTIKGQKNAYSD